MGGCQFQEFPVWAKMGLLTISSSKNEFKTHWSQNYFVYQHPSQKDGIFQLCRQRLKKCHTASYEVFPILPTRLEVSPRKLWPRTSFWEAKTAPLGDWWCYKEFGMLTCSCAIFKHFIVINEIQPLFKGRGLIKEKVIPLICRKGKKTWGDFIVSMLVYLR